MSWVTSEQELLDRDHVFKVPALNLILPSDYLWIHGRSRACVRVDHVLSFRVGYNAYQWGLAVSWMLEDPEKRRGADRLRTMSCLSWRGLWDLASQVLPPESNPFLGESLIKRTLAFDALLNLKEDGLPPEEVKLTRAHLPVLDQSMPAHLYTVFLQDFLTQRLRPGWTLEAHRDSLKKRTP